MAKDTNMGKRNHIDNTTIIRGFLALIPEMERLDLLWFNKNPCEEVWHESEAFFFDSTYEAILALPKLQDFCIRGLDVSEDTMMKFLTITTVKKISLRALRLRTSTWQSILGVLSSGRFDYIHMEDLYELKDHEYKRVFFKGVRRSKLGRGHNIGLNDISRRGDEKLALLQYSTNPWIQSGTRAVTIVWHMNSTHGTWI